jgi:hypothetical protein
LTPRVIKDRGRSGLRKRNRGIRHAARIALREGWLKQTSGEELKMRLPDCRRAGRYIFGA